MFLQAILMSLHLAKEYTYNLLHIIYKTDDKMTAFSDMEPDSPGRAAELPKQRLAEQHERLLSA